jgi:hypothetical protein
MARKPWNQSNPKPKSKRTKLSATQKAAAKRSAKAAGRPYPNLVDNMKAASRSRRGGRKSRG